MTLHNISKAVMALAAPSIGNILRNLASVYFAPSSRRRLRKRRVAGVNNMEDNIASWGETKS
jgi:hypothetical protein